MSTHRHIDAICLAVMALTLILTILFMNGKALGLRTAAEVEAEENADSPFFSVNDRNADWSTDGATRIVLEGSRIQVKGGGAYAYDNRAIITNAGRYVVSGTLDDGSLVVDADSNSKVWIQLCGAEIHNSSDACLKVEQAEKVFLTLAEGSRNLLETGGFDEAASAAGVDGALFSRDDLAINGKGHLTVQAAGENGIVSNDDLIIAGGIIAVSADADALHANDTLRIADASLTLEAGDDGVALTGVEGGLILVSGSLRLRSGDKGLAAGDSVLMLGGNVEIDAGADGINAAGSVRMEDGTLTITAADDGIHADMAVEIAGGSLNIPNCYEGIEARTIDISGGSIDIRPEDDGMNANGNTGFGAFGGFGGGPGGFDRPGGFDGMPQMPDGETPELPDGDPPELPEGEMPPMPAGTFDNGNSGGNDGETGDETWIHISGGNITIVNETARDADGLDSNGGIRISGGSIRISMLNSGSNNALDYGRENGAVMEISGGDVVACGSYNMAEGFSEGSKQASILHTVKRGVPGGTAIRLEDDKGTALLEYEVPCSFSSVILSCPELENGGIYSLMIGDYAEEIKVDS